jgi:hypothetical protein
MKTSNAKFMIPSLRTAPRGADAAGDLGAILQSTLASAANSLRRMGRGLWQSMERVGQARARRELLAMACRRQTDNPELARQLREAADYLLEPQSTDTWNASGTALAARDRVAPQVIKEAAEARQIAHRFAKSDPRFAADLYAAANRHEFSPSVDPGGHQTHAHAARPTTSPRRPPTQSAADRPRGSSSAPTLCPQ